MKKTLLLSVFLIHFIPATHAFDLELRAACLYPQEPRIRQIYGNEGFPEGELEMAGPVINKHWAAWGNLSYYRKNGHSSCLHDKTHLSNWTLTSGLKYFICLSDPLSPYVGLGAGIDYAHFNNHSSYIQSVNQWGIAAVAKSGLMVKLTELLFLDLFVDYSYNWLRTKRSRHCVSSRNINTGGLKGGVGLGFHF